MKDKKNLLVVALILAGLLFIAVAIFFGQNPTAMSESPGLKMATITLKNGRAQIYRNGSTQVEPVANGAVLYNLDTLETLEFAEAELNLENSGRIEVSESSVVTLERPRSHPKPEINLIVKRGEVHVEQSGRSQSLTISKNGKTLLAETYAGSELQKQEVANPIEASITNSLGVLTDEEISSVLSGRRTDFMKCFGQLLQKNPKAKGEALLNLSIEKSGKIKSVDYSSAQLKDEAFKRCVIDVASRINFRSFSGSTIVATFPIQFE